MIVMKFGGTSVGSLKSIDNVCKIIESRLDRNPLVVTSAHSGITNLLIAAAENAVAGKPDGREIEARQLGLVKDLGLDEALVRSHLDNLHDLLKGIFMLEELTPRTLDLVMSFGERMSSRVLAATLSKRSIKAVAIDAYDMGLQTDNIYGAANPDPISYPAIAKCWNQTEADVIVTTGFIGKCSDGHITTLGRGGSDYSATIMGAAIGAEEVEIWTDVNGVMTTDPNIVPAAKSLPEISFNEASELAWYGAKVLHPSTIIPAMAASIPVRVLNTMEPDNPGTVIVDQTTATGGVAKSVVYKKNLTLINITSTRMLMSHGFMAKVFNIFEKYSVVINMIATSEVTISLTTDASAENLKPALAELEQYSTVVAKDQHAIICLIGEGMGGVRGTAARVFDTLSRAGINVQMISQGAREINIAVCLNNADVDMAVKSLHQEFFE
ncbi:MAG: aspartate kinase [Planctomycetes bacterium]|nr:aspartate kinase [Planctomycetota bacterium]